MTYDRRDLEAFFDNLLQVEQPFIELLYVFFRQHSKFIIMFNVIFGNNFIYVGIGNTRCG